MTERIYLSPPHIDGEEMEFVKKAFESNWIAPVGPDINAFENELGNYITGVHAAALSSGTAAVHLALKLLGVGANDYVICQSLTFAGSSFPINYQGARPVFIDSEPETWNMDPNYLEDAIQHCIAKGKKPKALIYVHIYGMPARIDDIVSISNKYEIPLIEDAAEALGATYQNKNVGRFGDISILSFNGNKIITTSGGGALLSKNEDYVSQAKFLSTQARESALHYEHREIGYNYRMSNVCAAIGRGQLKNIDAKVIRKREIFDFYKSVLEPFKDIKFPSEPEGCFSNRWLTCILIDNVDLKHKIIDYLAQHNIESRPVWKPMHLQPVFSKELYFGSNTAQILFQKGMCLPSGSNLSKDVLSKISNLIISLL